MQIELHQLELRYSALRAWEPARRRKLLSALCEAGQQVPVVVVAAATTGHYVLIDGYLRVDVLRKILTAEVQAKVAAGQIPPQAAMKYLLPLARANGEDARKLVAGLGAQRISVRQMGRLYTAYRTADAIGRARLCDSPLLFLQMDAQAERGAEGQASGVDRLASDLGAIAGLCGRARRRACAEISIEEICVAQDRIKAGMGAARGSLSMLEQELGRRLEHDRPGLTDSDLHSARQGPGATRDRAGAGDLTEHGPTDSAERASSSAAEGEH